MHFGSRMSFKETKVPYKDEDSTLQEEMPSNINEDWQSGRRAAQEPSELRVGMEGLRLGRAS